MLSQFCHVAVVLFLLLSSSALGAQSGRFTPLRNNATCLPNYQLTWVAGSSDQSVLPAGTKYPACAYDTHQQVPSTTTWAYLYGGYDPTATTFGSTLYATTNAWATLAQPASTSTTVGVNDYGMAAVLANGNLVLVGGRADNTAATASNDVYYSTDHGSTFTLATANAPFVNGLYNGQLLAIPQTNNLVLIGGIDNTGTELKTVYLSQDGTGANWVMQSNASNLPASGLAGAVALYDNKFFNPSLYSSPNSTVLFFLEYSYGQYFMSYDLGATWTSFWLYPMSVSTATSSLSSSTSSIGHRDYMSFNADTDNNIYATGAYNGPDAFVWLSTTRGQSWQILHQSMAIPGRPTSLQYQWAQYNCMAVSYTNDTSKRQLTIYGYMTYTSDATTWQVLTAQVDTPIGQQGQGQLPNATISAPVDNAVLPAVTSPSCSYNIHALTSSPVIFTAGGQIGTTEQNVAYTSINNGAAFSQVSSTVWPSQPLFNAGSAVLANGNILLIGGQYTGSAASYQSTVYYSTDVGKTWTVSTATAAFGNRTNFATCAMPNTNTVYIVGGSYSNAGMAATDSAIFASYDGTGAAWSQVGTLPASTLAGTCVFLFDNTATSSSYTATNSTLLVFTHTMRLYRSYTGGSTWDSTPSQIAGTSAGALYGYITVPFATQYDNTATRYQLEVVADYDHNLYAMAGTGVYDNGLYFSGDIGLTWYRLKQTNNVNSGSFIQASTACLAMSYVTSGTTYTKQLTLYGGQGVVFDMGNNTYTKYSAVSFQLDSPATYVPSATGSQGTAQSTTQLIQQADATKLWCDDGTVGIQWQAASSATTSQYEKPACASGYMTADSTQSVPFVLYGGQSGTTLESKSVFSLDGFQTITNTQTNHSIGPRSGGHAAITASGAIIVAGGMTSSTTVSSSAIAGDTWISVDNGVTFTFVNNSFPAKAEGQLLSIPGSPGWLVMIGGYAVQGVETSDIWLSTDGQGAIWTLQTSTSPVPTNALASSFALYDSSWVSSQYSSPNATMGFLLEYSAGAYWMSYDLGRTWTVNYIYPMSTALSSASTITHRDWMELAVDRDNVIYAAGMSNNPEGQMWYSPTKGQTWYTLQNVPSVWATKSAYTQQSQIQYGCLGVQYGTSVVTGQRVKQLVAYGYFTYLSDGHSYSSIVGNLINAPIGQQVAPTAPTATLSSAVPVSSVNNGASPACAYNVHARNGAMVAIGGSNSATAAAFTASTNSFSSSAAGSLYSYNASSLPPVMAGGAALLNNGLLLSFGGLSTVDGVTLSNAVFSSSTTTGISFTQVANASWSPRANFITCTAPFSNNVAVIGGVTAVGWVNDVWISTDGQGAVWSQQPQANYPFAEASGTGANAGIQAGTCVFLYDSSLVPGSGSTQTWSTLLVFTHYNRVYKSLDGGATWVQQPNPYYPTSPAYIVVPFSTQYDTSKTRRGILVVADFDNRLYAMAGDSIWDNSMWWSQDGALTWYRLPQVNTITAGFFVQASTSCLGLNYRTNSSATGGYNKVLVLYGGNVQFDDGAKVGAMQVTVTDAVVFVATSANAVPFNATAVAALPTAPSSSASSSSSTGAASTTTSASAATSTSPSTATVNPTTTPTGSVNAASSSSSGSSQPGGSSTSSSSLSGGAIAGIVVGSVVGGMLICLSCVVCFVLRVRNNKKPPAETPQLSGEDLESTASASDHGVEMHATK